MNSITRFVRSMTRSIAPTNEGFEAYYGAIAMQKDGGPNATEARRDFQASQRIQLRIGMF